jgi:uncharacterized protein
MHHDKELALVQIFFIFILPIALIATGIVPVSWRMLVLCISLLLIIGIVRHERISDADMGIRNISFGALFFYTLFAIIGSLALWKGADVLMLSRSGIWWHDAHFVFLFLPVSLLQEIAYRGFLFPKLQVLFKNPTVIVLVNALIFGFLHVIYPFPLTMLIVSTIGGIGFSLLYYRFPNLLLVSAAHAVLNFVALYQGFFYFY